MTDISNATKAARAPSGEAQELHCHYLVYGQRLCSSLPLPELPRASFEVRDIAFRQASSDGRGGLPPGPRLCPVRFADSPTRSESDMVLLSLRSRTDVSLGESIEGRLLARRDTNLGCYLSLYETEEGFLLRWEGWCDFLVHRDGRTILWQALPGTGYGWVTSTLYGMVLAFALHLKGAGNLHASAVALPGGAIGFLADPGSGKSTLAAAFAACGHPFLTDDVLALREQGTGYLAYPGFPYVSLSAEHARVLLATAKRPADEPLNEGKQRVAVDGQWASFCPDPVPLKGLFALNRSANGSKTKVERLPRVEALRTLLENTNCLPLLPVEVLRRHMTFVARLTETVPVWRLTYPSGLEHAPGIVEHVLEQTTQFDPVVQSAAVPSAELRARDHT